MKKTLFMHVITIVMLACLFSCDASGKDDDSSSATSEKIAKDGSSSTKAGAVKSIEIILDYDGSLSIPITKLVDGSGKITDYNIKYSNYKVKEFYDDIVVLTHEEDIDGKTREVFEVANCELKKFIVRSGELRDEGLRFDVYYGIPVILSVHPEYKVVQALGIERKSAQRINFLRNFNGETIRFEVDKTQKPKFLFENIRIEYKEGTGYINVHAYSKYTFPLSELSAGKTVIPFDKITKR